MRGLVTRLSLPTGLLVPLIGLLPLLVTACGSADRHPPESTSAAQDTSAGIAAGLPAPSALRTSSYVDSGIMRTGSQYRDDWPHEDVYPTGLESVVLAPALVDVGHNTDIAYAMYSFNTGGQPIDSVVNLEWRQTASYQDCWVGLADFTGDSWRWYTVQPSNSITFDAATCIEGDSVYAVVVCIGAAAWELARIYLGADPAPQIQAVTPLSGVAGAEVDFAAALNIAAEDVDTWAWDFAVGATPGTSSEAAPHVTLGAAGIHHCELRTTNALGESTLSFLLTVSEPSASWHREAVDSISGMTKPTSIGIGPTGAEMVHIAYIDDDPGDVCHAYRADGCWVTQAVDDNSTFELTSSSLAVDSAGKCHLAYTSRNNLLYSYTQDGGWIITAATDDTTPEMITTAHAPSLALDSEDQAQVSMLLRITGEDYYEERIVFQDPLMWWWDPSHREVVDSGGYMDLSTLSDYCPLDIGPYDIPSIVYHDYGPGELRHTRLTDDWEEEDIGSAANVDCPAMKVSPGDGKPRLCYVWESAPGTGSINYVRPSGENWECTTIPDTGNAGTHLSLALSDLSRPHICYYEQALGELRYAYYTGLSWIVQVVDDSGDAGQFCDIAIDSDDSPHFSYLSADGYLMYARPAE